MTYVLSKCRKFYGDSKKIKKKIGQCDIFLPKWPPKSKNAKNSDNLPFDLKYYIDARSCEV